MNLLVIGRAGREHAICYKLRQSNRVNELFCLPGNAGTKKIAKNINQDISNFEEIYKILFLVIPILVSVAMVVW